MFQFRYFKENDNTFKSKWELILTLSRFLYIPLLLA